jgi:hypothetical protein
VTDVFLKSLDNLTPHALKFVFSDSDLVLSCSKLAVISNDLSSKFSFFAT